MSPGDDRNNNKLGRGRGTFATPPGYVVRYSTFKEDPEEYRSE